MKTNSLIRIILSIMIAGLLFLSCSPTSTSSVTIHIKLGLDNKAAFNTPENSIFDRILRFFAKDVKAQTAPLGITSIGLSVTGEGMSTINNSYPADTSTITLDVPAGPARVFQVTAYRPTGNWGGSSEQYDLEAGQSVEIPITMAEQYASVTINPAYPNGTPASSILTYTVNVTTSGQIVPTVVSFTPGAPIDVPAGASKDFEVLVNTPSVAFRGTVSINLAANSSVIITPSMTVYETKTVIPDYTNSRLDQINEERTEWIQRSSLTGVVSLRPHDIAFDNQGRIYVSNNVGGSGMGDNGVIRIDDINDTSSYLYPDYSTRSSLFYDYGIFAIAVDMNNDYIYYAATNNSLYRASIDDNTTHEQLTTASEIGLFRGIAVDDQGLLYIAGNNFSGSPGIFIYNPTTQSVVTSVTNAVITSLTTPWDVLIKPPYVYVTNLNGGTDRQVLQLDMNTLNFITGYGTAYTTTDTTQGHFYGASRFLAILNRKITIIDEGPGALQLSKLVFMDDIEGTNWETYGSYGSGTTEGTFEFFHSC